MAGQILGDRYEVERQLGKQTGRWTLLARDLQTDTLVVLKLLFVDEQLEWDDLKLFEREVEILQSLTHPSIPKYLGYFEQQLPNAKALVLIQTYVEGRSLEQCLQQGRLFNEAETRQIAKAILGILTYLHGRTPPIIHRDIKPSNILLANRQLHLVDFGSVKQVSGNDTTAFTVVGTYGYMPPEQFSGRAVPASDLYSVGATLLALMSGMHPSSLPRSGTKVDFSKIPVISASFAEWLGSLYDINLESRVKSAQAALKTLETGRTAPATPPAAPPTPVRKPAETKISLTKDPTFLEITLPSLIGQTQLQIDRQQISLTTKRLGIATGKPQTAPRQSLTHLYYRKPNTPNNDGNEAAIALVAGPQTFELKGGSLTPAELDWLAYELATWLKLPISE